MGEGAAPNQVLLGNPALAGEFNILAFPSYIIIDSHGRIAARRTGYMPGWMLSLYLAWYGVE
ncbi:hypothetical protein GCM10023333_40510 [Ferrimonas pelagia]|uniref:TlpA family protein disulfide reductase n=1 Tax=Ferrimonas pelagia TaxID=1177826 RepID=A0ABP9FGJ8_9GAMM